MNPKIILTSVAGLCLCTPLWGQNPSAMSPRASQSENSSGNNITQDTNTTSSSKSKQGSAFGQEIPVLDTSSESISFMGKNYSFADNMLADQFTSYLVQSPAKIEEAAEYTKTIREILDVLDRGTSGSAREKGNKAFHLLGKAAEYPQDFRICESLQNSLVMAKQAMFASSKSDGNIISMKERYAGLVRQMEFLESKTDLSEVSPANSGGKKGGKSKKQALPPGGVKSQENIRLRAELIAMMKKEEVQGALSEKLAKWQYQAMLMQLFMQRRFEHCVIGCRFYNIIFDKGENQLKIKSGSDLHKFFSETLGVQPTVAGLDSASNDVIGKAKSTIDGVQNHIRMGQVHSGTRRMLEAYVIGEHLTALHTFSPEQRMKMHSYIMNSKHLKDAVDYKNWQEAELYSNKLRDQADDFRYITAKTAIEGYKNASDLKVSEYHVEMMNKNPEKASLAMEQAANYWPTNPLITETKIKMMKLTEAQAQKFKTLENKKVEFEGIVRNEDYRGVSIKDAGAFQELFRQAKDNPQLEAGDRDRYRELFETATSLYNGLEAIETAIRSARALAERSQYYEAWEAIKLELDNEHVEESRLRDALSEYSNRAAKFRELFIEAEEFIESKNFGSALSCFLKAQGLFSSSKLASQGIDQLLARAEK